MDFWAPTGRAIHHPQAASGARPTAGEIAVFGRPMGPRTRMETLSQVGNLIESPSYYGHLTGAENLHIVQTPARGAGAGHRGGAAHRPAGRPEGQADGPLLPGHEAAGWAWPPPCWASPRPLILDEPTNGLDPAGIQEMRELIRSLPGRFGMTVVVSSHLLSEIDQMADHVGIIREGRLVFQDTPVRAPRPQLPPPGPAHHRQRRGGPPAGGEPVSPAPWRTAGSPFPALRRRCNQSLPLSGLPPGGSSAHGGAAEEPGRPLSGAHRKGGEPVKPLALEFCKCRRRKLTLVCAGLLAAQLLWFGAYLTQQDAGGAGSGVDASALQPGNGGRHYAPYRRGGDCQPEL